MGHIKNTEPAVCVQEETMRAWNWAPVISIVALASSVAVCVAQQMPTPEEAHCMVLRGTLIPADKIGAPVRRAVVNSADLVKGSEAAGGGYCKVLGSIEPVDPKAPDINFELNLPLKWNEKAIQYGGGGYDGQLIAAVANVSFGADSAFTPLQRGYATFGSDSGHQSPSLIDGHFLLNDEALANFGGLQIKKTHDAAMTIIAAYFNKRPARTYIQGNSQGGHESLIGIQRWPADYDGAIVTHPANPFSALQLSGLNASKAFYGKGSYISPAKVELLNNAVMKACDGLDGVEDGIISNTAKCDATFKIESLRCKSGADDGDTCFSDAQIAALNTINTPYKSPVALSNGVDGFSRWPIFLGADLYGVWGMGLSPAPTNPPSPVANFGLAVFQDPFIRYAIARTEDPKFNSLTFEPKQYAARIRQVSELVDANSADLSAFEKRGGKVLMMHGTIDFAISMYNTSAYYERIVKTMGQAKADSFLRYYVVPGFGHGTGTFIARWDPLTALESWVEKGEAPKALVVTDAAKGTVGRARPMCVYPSYPVYNDGATDPNKAESFHCAK
jgi:hypothetical protein